MRKETVYTLAVTIGALSGTLLSNYLSEDLNRNLFDNVLDSIAYGYAGLWIGNIYIKRYINYMMNVEKK